ncbi:response regulator [Pseudosporangium ferrugineum]|uniref:Response regulator receiver domain-containing protein n=1 Tax=Pseudosporangium ferrugineum TaxID=439699 RepID=A0A2T0RG86_9ACTN|nr:response regulator [Pseudosporangium ferrugineum]PRY20178.1 response regulator receiver domain-containing protein [Pseudosporangium ferrugineum]
MVPATVEFLLVQDDPAEELYLREMWETHKVLNRVHAVHDARRAVDFLQRRPPYESAPVPDVVLLDLSLPGHDGRHLLQWLRDRPETGDLPVVVLVDSPAAEWIVRREALPVQGYVTKPVDFARLTDIVRTLESAAFLVVARPS